VWSLFPDLYDFRTRRVRTLSGGQQQMVVVGRALMSSPKVLMLDEPSFGLSPRLTELMCDRLIELQTAGFSILLAEQNIDVAFAVAPMIAVLSAGQIVELGTPSELSESTNFAEAMFGTIDRRPSDHVAQP
jgi:branched-chain amino acid transport system ATP-binding protein